MNSSPKLCLYPNRLIIINVCFLYKNMAVIRMRQTIFSYIHHMYRPIISIENLQRNIGIERENHRLCNVTSIIIKFQTYRIVTRQLSIFSIREENVPSTNVPNSCKALFLCASILLEDIQSSFCPPKPGFVVYILWFLFIHLLRNLPYSFL